LPWPHHGVEPAQRGLRPYLGPRVSRVFFSCSPIASRRSASDASTAALIAAIRLPSGARSGVATANASPNVTPRLKASRRERISGSSVRNCRTSPAWSGPGEVEEAVHLVVGDVGQQSLSGGAGVQRATGVGACDECQAGGFFADEVGEDDGVPDAHPDQDGAAEHLGQLGHELVIK
jgi:hypothetical protein